MKDFLINEWDRILIVIVAIIILVVVTLSDAKADSIDINLTSWHANKDYDYNTQNFGIGITKDIDHHWAIKTGVFKNSYYKESGYFMGRLQHRMRGWRFGINFGFITGYDNIAPNAIDRSRTKKRHHGHRKHHKREDRKSKLKNYAQAVFIVMPTLTWNINKTHALELGLFPSFDPDSSSFATLQYQISF